MRSMLNDVDTYLSICRNTTTYFKYLLSIHLTLIANPKLFDRLEKKY